MTYGRLTLVVVAAALAACAPRSPAKQPFTSGPAAEAAAVARSLAVGTFKHQEGPLHPSSVKRYLTIDETGVTQATRCRVRGQVVWATAGAFARVTADSFTVDTAVLKIEHLDGIPCGSVVQAGTVAYEVRGDGGLYLTRSGDVTVFYGYRVGSQPNITERIGRGAAVLKQTLDEGFRRGSLLTSFAGPKLQTF